MDIYTFRPTSVRKRGYCLISLCVEKCILIDHQDSVERTEFDNLYVYKYTNIIIRIIIRIIIILIIIITKQNLILFSYKSPGFKSLKQKIDLKITKIKVLKNVDKIYPFSKSVCLSGSPCVTAWVLNCIFSRKVYKSSPGRKRNLFTEVITFVFLIFITRLVGSSYFCLIRVII